MLKAISHARPHAVLIIDFVFLTPKGLHGEIGALSAICVVTKMVWYRAVWGRSALDAAWALYAVVMDSAVVPMKIEIKGGLNHFYALHPQGTYHSIYKIVDGKWYEQMRGIWHDGGGRPDAFLVYEKF